MGSLVPEYMKIRQYVLNLHMSIEETEKLPSEREMTKMFGVSRDTVRKALSDLISEGYIISRARSGNFIAPGQSFIHSLHKKFNFKRIGIVKDKGMRITFSWHDLKVMSGMYEALSNRAAIVEYINFSKADERIARELKLLNLDGVIWHLNVPANAEFIAELVSADKELPPIFFINFTPAPPVAGLTNFLHFQIGKDYYKATDYLFQLRHKKIAYVGYNPSIPGCKNDLQAFKKAHKDHNVPLNPDLIIEDYEGTMDRFEGMLISKNMFSAVLCRSVFCDSIYEIAEKRGLSIPEDFSLITEDDVYSHLSGKNPTRLTQPLHKIGFTAADKLMDIIEGKIKPPFQIESESNITIGDSCKKLI